VNSGHSLFFEGKRKLLKTFEYKNYIPYSEKFLGDSVFQGKRSCSKILNSKKCIQYSEKFQVKLCFSEQAQVVKIYIHYSENFQGNSVFFRASASCSKIVNCEKIFNTMYIYLGAIRVIWASVVCNQDQRRDWL